MSEKAKCKLKTITRTESGKQFRFNVIDDSKAEVVRLGTVDVNVTSECTLFDGLKPGRAYHTDFKETKGSEIQTKPAV